MSAVKTAVKKTAGKPAKKPAPKTSNTAKFDEVWAILEVVGNRLDKFGKDMDKVTKAHQETEKVLGRLGSKQGDIAEATLVPNLPEKFRKFGFTFQVISRRRKIADDEHGIHSEVDAFLENGDQAMAVEVKTTLRHEHVDYHIERMEKIRQYADLHNDKRQFFGALAAAVIDDDTKRYALKQGFYIIEPSGEDVKITKPVSKPKVW